MDMTPVFPSTLELWLFSSSCVFDELFALIPVTAAAGEECLFLLYQSWLTSRVRVRLTLTRLAQGGL